jgi:predicted nuclease of predicted toxin-antitoxin system
LRLLLDEMYPYSIAEQLRARGHDVVAVGERPALRGAPDAAIFAAAQEQRRAIVTDDVGFRAIEAEHRARGEPHHGVIFTTNRRFPRGRAATVGRLVRALDRFLSHQASSLADGPSFTWWLR